ncbi:MAG: UTRA domain-containing protein [Pseudonocardiales bacterium]|nr:UTRA domain-containing protein [Pseudonocardiales bacterium]
MIGAPPEMSMRLDVEVNTPVVLRRRLFLVEDHPSSLVRQLLPRRARWWRGRRSPSHG